MPEPETTFRSLAPPTEVRGRAFSAPGWRILVTALAAACAPGGTEETARNRGDIAFARDSLELARAEYRLSVEADPDAEGLARLAHTYIELGRVDEARDFYEEAVLLDRDLVDQAAGDFLRLAQEASGRDDTFQMASAMDAALTFAPGVSVQDMALPLARHYFENGEYGRALPFYQDALAQTPEPDAGLVFEIGQAHHEIGDCERAIPYFESFREMVRPWERLEVDWYIGTCSLELAKALRARVPRRRGRSVLSPEDTMTLEEALALVDRTLEVGEPSNAMADAYFERGELLSRLSDCEGARRSFDEVVRLEPSPNTARARRAADRSDEIRFGGDLRELRPARDCG